MNSLASNAPGSNMFVTNVGLITSDGPNGPNIMTAAWTHQISYEPPLIMVNVEVADATLENILDTQVFGVNLSSVGQNIVSNISGSYTGKKINKIKVLQDLGIEFYEGEKIKVLMVKGALLNAECKLVKHEQMGDHIILVGEVLKTEISESQTPLIYTGGKYWKLGENIQKPEPAILEKIKNLADKHSKF